MQYSDTSNKNGLLQECEFWTNLGDGSITGNATLKAQFTSRLNRAYDAIMPLLFAFGDKMRWDDSNHLDHPIATFDITSGVGDYELLTDDNGLSILNITDLMILPGATTTEYVQLDRITLDDPRALRAMSKNPSDTGIPSAFVEKGNVVFFDVTPDFNATAGGKLFFERNADYFTTGDTTQTPGIPAPFHQLLALHASLDWLLVFKSEATTLIAAVQGKITKKEAELKTAIDLRNPVRRRVVGRSINAV